MEYRCLVMALRAAIMDAHDAGLMALLLAGELMLGHDECRVTHWWAYGAGPLGAWAAGIPAPGQAVPRGL